MTRLQRAHLFTHNDWDGVSPAILLKKVFKNRLKTTLFCSYSNINKKLLQFLNKNKKLEEVIYITDIGINEEVAELLDERHKNGQEIYLIDHHASNMYLNKYEWATVEDIKEDIMLCATTMVYEHLLERELLEESTMLSSYVENVRLYDTWDWFKENKPLPKKINDLFFMLPIRSFINMANEVIDSDQNKEFFIPEEYHLLLEVEENRIDKYIESKEREMLTKEIQDYQVGIIYADKNQSEIGSYIGEKYLELDIVAIVDISNKKVSVRTSKEDVDVSTFAETYDGGGHPKSSGFFLNEDNFFDFVFYK